MVWTFTSGSCGYTLYKDGVMQGGTTTLGSRTHTADGRRKSPHNVRADIKMHAQAARSQCERNNSLDAQKTLQPIAALTDQA